MDDDDVEELHVLAAAMYCLRHAYPIGIPQCADNRSMHRR